MKNDLLHVVILVVLYQLCLADMDNGVCVHPTHSKNVNLKYDEALFQIRIHPNSKPVMANLTLNGMSSLCYECNLVFCASGLDGIDVKIDTTFEYRYEILQDGVVICSSKYQFMEHGHYIQYILYNENTLTPQCADVVPTQKHDFVYEPLLVMAAIIVFVVLLYNVVGVYIRRKESKRQIGYTQIVRGDDSDHLSNYNSSSSTSTHPLYGSNVAPNNTHYTAATNLSRVPPALKYRIKSLDTFRGISIVVMIFVNYTGGSYWFFNHSAWNGLTVADLVFPWFIFIMGSSIFISQRSLLRKHISKKKIAVKILIRTIKLLLLGLFLNKGYDLPTWRLPGVLQRFALSYFVVAIVNLLLSPHEDKIDTHYSYDWRDAFRDLFWFPFQHLVMMVLLVVYLLILYFVHDPDCPRGYMGPGGYGDYGKYPTCTGGAHRYIDLKVFGYNHIYHGTTCKTPYNCVAHDPEGLLGVLPSIILTYLGLQAARILFLYSKQESHIKRWLIWAVIWGCVAAGLCGGTQNNGVIPVNKNLWSLSFIFATASMAYVLLTVCYVLVDVKKWWGGGPFYFAGMNAILLYIGHEVFRDYFPFGFHDNSQHSELLTRAAVGTTLWTVISYICFRKNIFLKL